MNSIINKGDVNMSNKHTVTMEIPCNIGDYVYYVHKQEFRDKWVLDVGSVKEILIYKVNEEIKFTIKTIMGNGFYVREWCFTYGKEGVFFDVDEALTYMALKEKTEEEN